MWFSTNVKSYLGKSMEIYYWIGDMKKYIKAQTIKVKPNLNIFIEFEYQENKHRCSGDWIHYNWN